MKNGFPSVSLNHVFVPCHGVLISLDVFLIQETEWGTARCFKWRGQSHGVMYYEKLEWWSRVALFTTCVQCFVLDSVFFLLDGYSFCEMDKFCV